MLARHRSASWRERSGESASTYAARGPDQEESPSASSPKSSSHECVSCSHGCSPNAPAVATAPLTAAPSVSGVGRPQCRPVKIEAAQRGLRRMPAACGTGAGQHSGEPTCTSCDAFARPALFGTSSRAGFVVDWSTSRAMAPCKRRTSNLRHSMALEIPTRGPVFHHPAARAESARSTHHYIATQRLRSVSRACSQMRASSVTGSISSIHSLRLSRASSRS